MEAAAQINALLSTFPRKTSYLEIGVQEGITFDAVNAQHKTAVDPRFLFEPMGDSTRSYHPTSSDTFFFAIPETMKFDVIFIDGLHTFEQTLRDFTNATRFLSDDGYILIDDVKPSSFAASIRDSRKARLVKMAIGERTGSWMGDVYRLVYFIDSFFQQFSFQLINAESSRSLVWRQPREHVADRRVRDVGKKSYRDVRKDFGHTFDVIEFEDWFNLIQTRP